VTAAEVPDRAPAAPAGPPRVRPARPDERERVRTLTLAAYAEYAGVMAPAAWAGLDAAVRAALDGAPAAGAECLVAELGADLAGSVFLFPPAAAAYGALAGASDAPELRLLAVAPGARGRGVGEALVRACAERARAAGATALGLHTSASMAAAQRMYARLGFARAPESDFAPDGAELVEGYRLRLAGG
jgi:GNAT superfamily N-acetyltransferase